MTDLGEHPFDGCESLTTISVNAANPTYSSLDGVLYNKLQTTLISCPADKTGSFAVPNQVTRIGDQAFFRCGELTAISLPNGLTSIGVGAFERCEKTGKHRPPRHAHRNWGSPF